MNLQNMSVAIVATVALSSCRVGPHIDSMYAVRPLTTDQITDKYQQTGIPDPLDLKTLRLAGEENTPAIQSASNDSSGSDRNRLKSLLVNRSKLICLYTQAQIIGTNDWLNFGLGETTTALGAIGSLVTAATPARVLSGLAGLVNSTRTQVNEVFYQNALKVAIIQKIDSIRSAQLALINSHIQDSLADYSVEDMLSDVNDYHKDCSFFVGVTSLTQPTSSQVNDSSSSSGGGMLPNQVTPSPNSPTIAASPAPDKQPLTDPTTNLSLDRPEWPSKLSKPSKPSSPARKITTPPALADVVATHIQQALCVPPGGDKGADEMKIQIINYQTFKNFPVTGTLSADQKLDLVDMRSCPSSLKGYIENAIDQQGAKAPFFGDLAASVGSATVPTTVSDARPLIEKFQGLNSLPKNGYIDLAVYKAVETSR